MMALVATAGSLELHAAAHRSLARARQTRCTAAERRATPALCAPSHVLANIIGSDLIS